jgi:hypothetical protein
MDANEPNDVSPTDEQLDDVEAHGLKEIAAGIGAAAVLGGAGAGAALAASSALATPSPVSPAHHVTQQAHDDATQVRGMFNHRTPTPPVSVTANVTRKPTPLPRVHLPHARGMEAEANAPVGQGLKPAIHAAKKAADKVVNTTKDKTVPPITGPLL